MNTEQRGILTLLKSAVTGQALRLPDGFVLADAMPIVEKHSIYPMVYLGAVQCGIAQDSPLMQQLFMQYYVRMLRSEKQMAAVRQLFDAFEAQGIDYMPLKGCNMKALYPKPELRQMGDADVLIKEEQYDQIRAIVEAQGYTEGIRWDHVFLWRRSELELELHRKLIPEEEAGNSEYYGSGWQLARGNVGHRYRMSAEDEYVFLFAHFVKHYRGDGIGIRHVLDLWVYQQKNPGLDMNIVRRELENMRLNAFHDHMCSLLRVWFEDAEADERSDFITGYIFANGIWGTQENHDVSKAARRAEAVGSVQRGKLQQLEKLLVPPREIMTEQYPVLNRHPWLLPLLVPVRLVRILLLEREKFGRVQRKMNAASADSIETYRQAMNYVGLDVSGREDD